MSIFTITPNYVETTSFITQIERTIVSSSAGVTGLVHLTARPTSFLKEVHSWIDGFADTPDADAETDVIIQASDAYKDAEASGSSANISSLIQTYLSLVNASSEVPRNSVTFSPVRYTQPAIISADTTDLDADERQYFMKRVINNN